MTRYATYRRAGSDPRVGVVHGDGASILDLSAAALRSGSRDHPFASMLSLMDAGERGLDQSLDLLRRFGSSPDLSVPVEGSELLAPVPEPRQMRDCMCYPTHIRQSARGMRRLAAAGDAAALAVIEAEPLAPMPATYAEIPAHYLTNRLVVGGHDTVVRWPPYSQVIDYELEVGVFVGRTGRDLNSRQAREAIFGYTIFNDFSARDQQLREAAGMMGPGKGKSFDGSNVIGPWIVTPDEVGDPLALRTEVRVNGEARSRGSTAGALFSFEELIAHMSRGETIRAGEFLASGTVGGGCGLETGRFLGSGDTVELEVERIGILRNRVEARG